MAHLPEREGEKEAWSVGSVEEIVWKKNRKRKTG